MANSCDTVQNLFRGDGTTTVFSFTFEYDETKPEEVNVSLFDTTTKYYVPLDRSLWSFDGPTVVRLDTAPPAVTDKEGNPIANVKVWRQTDIDSLIASFYPGSAIRAQDLNANFEQLRQAILEGRCIVPTPILEYIQDNFWDKYGDTIDSTETWISDDEHVATTGAINIITTDIYNDINDINNDINGFNDDISKIEGEITDINVDISKIDEDITKIEGDITDINSDISKIDGDITDIDGSISDIKSDVSTNANNIAKNTSDIQSLEANPGVTKIIAGDNVNISPTGGEGVVTVNAAATPYSLPIASASTLGGVKVGNNLVIDETGILSAIDSGGGGGSSKWTEDNGKLYPKNPTNEVQVGGSAADPNIVLNSNGSITATGSIQTGGLPWTGVKGCVVAPQGNIYVSGAAGNAIYQGYLEGSTTATITIKSDGDVSIGDSSATFLDKAAVIAALTPEQRTLFATAITAWNNRPEPYTAEDPSTLPTDTPLREAIVRATTAGKINLNSDGSITAASRLAVGSTNNGATVTGGYAITAYNDSDQSTIWARNNKSGQPVFTGVNAAGNFTTQIFEDGNITAAGSITANTFDLEALPALP